jgi:hypothetical protein
MFSGVEKPSPGASTCERAEFRLLHAHGERSDARDLAHVISRLAPGDVIAYRVDRWPSLRDIQDRLGKNGYRVLRYGHLALVVTDPGDAARRRLFSSDGVKGPHVDDDLASLAQREWDAYRLDRHERLDRAGLDAFVRAALLRAHVASGEDFSTLVAAALHHAGLELDAIRSPQRERWTPRRLVGSRGRIVTSRDVDLAPASATPNVAGWLGAGISGLAFVKASGR